MNNSSLKGSDDLGKIISTHDTGFWPYWYLFLLSGLIFLLVLILAAAPIHPNGNGIPYVIYLVLIVSAIVPLYLAWYHSINEARLYEKGFVYITRRSKKTVLWSEVKCVYEFAVAVNVNGISTAPQYRFGVRTQDGMIVRFSPRLWKISELGSVLTKMAEQLGCPILKGVPYRFGSAEPEPTKMLDL